MIEDTFRSLNNLLEHLHHSMFFYLLPNVDSFIPISYYSPIIVLLLLPLLIVALSSLTPAEDEIEFAPVQERDDSVCVVLKSRGSWGQSYVPIWEGIGSVSAVYLLGITLYAVQMALSPLAQVRVHPCTYIDPNIGRCRADQFYLEI